MIAYKCDICKQEINYFATLSLKDPLKLILWEICADCYSELYKLLGEGRSPRLDQRRH
jgi:hypothetical protein